MKQMKKKRSSNQYFTISIREFPSGCSEWAKELATDHCICFTTFSRDSHGAVKQIFRIVRENAGDYANEVLQPGLQIRVWYWGARPPYTFERIYELDKNLKPILIDWNA